MALIPVLERAHIPWQEGEAYDQWDQIAAVLYDKLVREPLSWALPGEEELALCDYDVVLPTWRYGSFVAVRHPSLPSDLTAVFLRFRTRRQTLDTVAVAVLNGDLVARSDEVSVPVDQAAFALFDGRRGQQEVISSFLLHE